MKLKYILGRPGTGKTETSLNEIAEMQSLSSAHTLIYIVPEQFSLQSEKNLILKAGNQVLAGAQVLSFKRLAFRLFSEVGGANKNILEEIGKIMLLRKIVYEIKDELKFFKATVDKQGFFENLSRTITEFFQYGINIEALEEAAEKASEKRNLYLKLIDLKKIYESYLDYINEKYISTDEMLDVLADRLLESKQIQGAYIWIDGFTGFTPQEYKVIDKLFKKASAITVAMAVDTTEYGGLSTADPFYKTKYTMKKLSEIAADNNAVSEYVFLSDRFKAAEGLAFLEANYFEHTGKKCTGASGIHIFAAKNKYSEITITARDIIKLVRDDGYRYSDIAIIIGSMDYEKQIKCIFRQFDIPFFIDSKKDIISHPFTELICSLLEIITTNRSYEAVFRFFKTGLTPIDDDDVNILENYVLAFGIKGRRWELETWHYGFEQSSEFDKDHVNHIKDCVTGVLSGITSAIKPSKKYTVKDISVKIFELLYDIDVSGKLSSWILTAKCTHDDLTAHEHSQIWGLVTGVFEKMVEIMGDEKVTAHEYAKILNSGLSECDMGLIPPTQDRVIVGDLERTQLPDIKALFVLGVNDGVLPSATAESGIFSEQERGAMLEYGMELSAGKERKVNEEQFRIYSALTKPSEFLQLSYATGSLDGKQKRPSSIINKIKLMFPDLKELSEDLSTSSGLEDITTPKPTIEHMGRIISDYIKTGGMPDIYKDAYNWFEGDKDYSSVVNSLIEQGLFSGKADYLSARAAKKLYGNAHQTSVSKLEKFMQCPFSFFVQYGLRLKQRSLYQIKPPDLGNLFHKVLEDFSKELQGKDLSWRDLDKPQIDGIVESAIERIAPTLGNEILLSSERYKYLIKRIKRITKRSVWALSEHIKRGMFEPFGYEIGFGVNEKLPPIIVELSEGSKLVLTGKIDRIDILDSDGKGYVKIIDYKSGSKKYDLQEIYYGIQLQLTLYLDAFIKSYKKLSETELLPGGMFYFKIDDPMLSLENILSDDELENTLLRQFKVSGLVLNNESIINALDNEAKGHSPIAPLYFSSGGVSSKLSSLASAEEFDALRSFVFETVKDIGDEIVKGNVRVYPYKKRERTACDYCIYKSICRFERETAKYRNIKPLSEPWELIKQD